MFYTVQEAFNKICEGLVAQGRGSFVQEIVDADGDLEPVRCMYRGAHGAKCAVGILIDDTHYNPVMEGISVGNDIVSEQNKALHKALLASGIDLEMEARKMKNMLYRMQEAHDTAARDSDFLSRFKSRAQDVARIMELDMPKCILE
jgi:hypothetical protein